MIHCVISRLQRHQAGRWLDRLGPYLLCLGLLLTCLGVASAAELDATTVADTTQAIAAERARLEEVKTPSDDQKQQLAQLDKAANLLSQAASLTQQIKQLEQTIREAPKRVAKLKKRPADASVIDPKRLERLSTEELRTQLGRQQQALDLARQAMGQHESKLADYLAAAKSGGAELAKVRADLDALAAAGEDGSTAQRLLQRAHREWLSERRQWLKLQQANLDVLIELQQAERDAAAVQLKRLQENVRQLTAALNKRQVEQLQKSREQPQTGEVQAQSPAEADLQQRLAALTNERSQIVVASTALDVALADIKGRLEQIHADRQRMEQILQVAKGDDSLSAMLRKRRVLLPSPASLAVRVQEYRQQLEAAVLRQLELDEASRQLVVSGNYAASAPLDGADSKGATAPVSKRLAELRRQYASTLQDMVRIYSTHIARLADMEATLGQLETLVDDYHAFIISNLLWMPSSDVTLWLKPLHLVQGLEWLVRPAHLRQLLADTLESLRQRPLVSAAWILVVLVLLGLRHRALAGIAGAAEVTRRVRTDRLSATLAALLWSLVLILPLPLVLLGPGLLLGSLATASEYSLRVGAGLQGVGHTLLFIEFFRVMCRPSGVAAVHFRWHSELCKRLRTVLAWLLPLAIPAVFLQSASAAGVPSGFIHLAGIVRTDEPGLSLLGRVGMLTLMISVFVAVRRIWGSNQPWVRTLADASSPPRWVQYHAVWFTPALLLPLLLAGASILGYDYTAAYFLAVMGQTLWLLIGLRILQDLLLRGLYVNQRRLRLEQALQAREAAREQARTGTDEKQEIAPELPPIDEAAIDYGELSGQVRQLLKALYVTASLVGLWWLWRDVFPALDFLNDIQLPINTNRLINGASQTVPLTVGDLIAGLIMGGIVFLAARNVPGLLELTLLQRLPLRPATRYAIVTLTQYTIAMVGVVIVLKAVGLEWSSIQWLVAALSVGLGFGLQEIVANFISGVILLFEQPIRVGDLVTVDNVTGRVTKIRIRATTILNWDRQELLVPNKTFITGQLINWTLSDTVNRVIITVGVAYGSDTRKAMALMEEAAAEDPKVLADPPPRVSFEGFGDNSLTLLLRAYLGDVDTRLATITDLHQAINDKMEAAGIEISFPQRDVHLDTSRPLELVLRGGDMAPP